jgi:DNA-binding GntR family transcriptional regulator
MRPTTRSQTPDRTRAKPAGRRGRTASDAPDNAAEGTAAGRLPIVPVGRDTLQDRVHRQLSDLILDGEIAPGQLVTINGLAEAFGVSAMPVREALKRLTAANALTVVSGRTIGIPPLSRDRLDDLHRVRLEVERCAVIWAAERIGTDDIAILDGEFAALQAAVAAGDTKGFLRANRAFHFAVYRAAGSPVLLAVIETLWLQISPYFNLLHGSGNYTDANRHHAEMLAAIRKRDARRLGAAVRADIDGAYDMLARLVSPADRRPAD